MPKDKYKWNKTVINLLDELCPEQRHIGPYFLVMCFRSIKSRIQAQSLYPKNGLFWWVYIRVSLYPRELNEIRDGFFVRTKIKQFSQHQNISSLNLKTDKIKSNRLSVLSPNTGKGGKNTDQNNSEYGHFLHINK